MSKDNPIDIETQQKIKDIIKRHSNSIHVHYSGDESEQIASILNHYERLAASAISNRKTLIDDALVYFRSVTMLFESVGMASTHAEKSARLRGLIELLQSAIKKLKNEKEEELLNNWHFMSWDYSQYPYQSVLEKYGRMKAEHEELKKKLSGDSNETFYGAIER